MNNFNFKQWLEAAHSNITSIEQALHTLKLPPNPTPQQIKKAYWTLSKQAHPDNGGSPEQQKLLNAAYEFLQAPEKHTPKTPPPPNWQQQTPPPPPPNWQFDNTPPWPTWAQTPPPMPQTPPPMPPPMPDAKPGQRWPWKFQPPH